MVFCTSHSPQWCSTPPIPLTTHPLNPSHSPSLLLPSKLPSDP